MINLRQAEKELENLLKVEAWHAPAVSVKIQPMPEPRLLTFECGPVIDDQPPDLSDYSDASRIDMALRRLKIW